MDRIKGLKEYVKSKRYLEGMAIPADAEIAYEPLAQGEYNINYIFVHPKTNKRLVLRINTASQMHLEDQIVYEYNTLKQLESSGRTPRVVYVDGSLESFPYGVLVMEYLEGRALDYRKDMLCAAQCLADIHNVRITHLETLIHYENPMKAILDECESMFRIYEESTLGDPHIKKLIREKLYECGDGLSKDTRTVSYQCCINTELNSGNFLVNGAGKKNYLIDWEKPLFGDPAQDLGHFLAPTTTFWKTDVILTEKEMDAFIQLYKQAVDQRFEVGDLDARVKEFVKVTCLRGITWCAMAWVEYQDPNKLIKNAYTYEKIEKYLHLDFILSILSNRK